MGAVERRRRNARQRARLERARTTSSGLTAGSPDGDHFEREEAAQSDGLRLRDIRFMPLAPNSYATLSAMITPAIFLTANGSLIISTSNRMSRVIDRIRILNDLSDRICRGKTELDYARERVAHNEDQLERLVWRSNRIRYALVLLYLAFGAFVCTSLALAIDVWSGNQLLIIPTCLAVVGVGLMLGACINLVLEALQALRSNRLEIRFFRELHDRRKAEGSGCSPA